jgi:hypothetical protein
MTTHSIRELKQRYKLLLAQGKALTAVDQPIALPLSTGNSLFDAALTDKLQATATMNEAEHLRRGWDLVRGASHAEREALARHGQSLLNDYKLLLALSCWERGEDELTRQFLFSLPWGWRLGFPVAIIKPGAQLFTGWRRDLRFRLVTEPRFDALKNLYRGLLAQAPPTALMKYRRTIHSATALLHYRFEGEREEAIKSWCFGDGRAAMGMPDLEPLGSYVRARDALATGGASAFLDVLDAAPHPIPITSYLGLIGGAGLSLTEKGTPALQRLRDYTLTCATPVENVLRLAEWSPWLTETRVEQLSEKVRGGLERGIAIPFSRVLKAFLAAPVKTRKLLREPLLLPLLTRFGEQTTGLLPAPGPITFVQPANYVNAMSFLLYATLASVGETRLLLVRKKRVVEFDPIPLERVGAHLTDDRPQLEAWLLKEFGGEANRYDYTYDWRGVGKALEKLDPQAPLLLDLPWASELDMLEALLPFERAFNLNSAYGAPGELCVANRYYCDFFMGTYRWSYQVWSRYSDSAATGFAELLERLGGFAALAKEADAL